MSPFAPSAKLSSMPSSRMPSDRHHASCYILDFEPLQSPFQSIQKNPLNSYLFGPSPAIPHPMSLIRSADSGSGSVQLWRWTQHVKNLRTWAGVFRTGGWLYPCSQGCSKRLMMGRVGIGTQSWQDSGGTDRSSRSISTRDLCTVFQRMSRLMLNSGVDEPVCIAIMLFQGMIPVQFLPGWVGTWDAASPTVSISLTNDRSSWRSSLQVVPHPSPRERHGLTRCIDHMARDGWRHVRAY